MMFYNKGISTSIYSYMYGLFNETISLEIAIQNIYKDTIFLYWTNKSDFKYIYIYIWCILSFR